MACHDPQEFPNIAKRMGFNFNLRKDRVDWHMIDHIDIDRLVEERDLMTLRENLINVVNFKVDDIKLTDVVKMFRLAQLSVNYLMYSEKHAFNCLEIAEQQMKKVFKELERLKEECKKKTIKLEKTRKKTRDLEKLHNTSRHPRCICATEQLFKCFQCPKIFFTEKFLKSHCERRHGAQTEKNNSNDYKEENEKLQSQVTVLLDRLTTAEKVIEDSTQTVDKLSSDLLNLHHQLENQDTSWKSKLSLLKCDHEKEIEDIMRSLRNKEEGLLEMKLQLENQENAWQLKVDSLKSEYEAKLEDLRASISIKTEEGKELKSIYDGEVDMLKCEIEKLNSELKHQGEYIQQLITQEPLSETAKEIEKEARQENISMKNIEHKGKLRVHTLSEETDKSNVVYGDKAGIITVNDSHQHDKEAEKRGKGNTLKEDKIKINRNDKVKSYHHTSNKYSSVDSRLNSSVTNETLSVVKNFATFPPNRNKTNTHLKKKNIIMHSKTCDSSHYSSETDFGSESQAAETNEEDSNEEKVYVQGKRNTNKYESVKEVILSNTQILTNLRRDLQEILNKKLQELGIDPTWTRLPTASFQRSMSILNHHQKVAAKKYADYYKIKHKIEEIVNKKVSNQILLRHSKSKRTGFPKNTKKPIIQKVFTIKQQSRRDMHFLNSNKKRSLNISSVFLSKESKGNHSTTVEDDVQKESVNNIGISYSKDKYPATVAAGNHRKIIAKSVKFMSDVKDTSLNQSSDADDRGKKLDISTTPLTSVVEQYQAIRLKTKQSDKIAELCRNMGEQLQFVANTKPVGGIETVFRKLVTTSDIPTSSNIGKSGEELRCRESSIMQADSELRSKETLQANPSNLVSLKYNNGWDDDDS